MAAIAGLVGSLLMVIPLGAFGLGILAAGALSVLLYRRRVPSVNLTPGMGARLGAASGALGFGMFAILTAVATAIGGGDQLKAALIDALEKSAARSSEPQAQELIHFFKTPEGLAVMMGFVLLVTLVIFVIFSGLGGAISAALLRRRNRL